MLGLAKVKYMAFLILVFIAALTVSPFAVPTVAAPPPSHTFTLCSEATNSCVDSEWHYNIAILTSEVSDTLTATVSRNTVTSPEYSGDWDVTCQIEPVWPAPASGITIASQTSKQVSGPYIQYYRYWLDVSTPGDYQFVCYWWEEAVPSLNVVKRVLVRVQP